MPKDRKDTSEQAILDAAEEVFLTKGFAGARTTEIAKLAGVYHGMLHYYHGTKEELFSKVFDKKLQLLNHAFSFALEQNISFIEKIKSAIEAHFDFLLENPKLPLFIINEVMANPERKIMFKKLFAPKIGKILTMLEKEMKEEIEKGTIRNISPADLLLHIGSVNATSILPHIIMSENSNHKWNKKELAFWQQKRAENVEFVLRGISP
ncbi:MAG: TetR/AcrR family transcriptional regulator [Bacteroidales bacterium]|jgi:AcrR family transcriptional regulator|nr:TetR/AcrR family transcriptional regulator [Bacteroidales bacterium]